MYSKGFQEGTQSINVVQRVVEKIIQKWVFEKKFSSFGYQNIFISFVSIFFPLMKNFIYCYGY